MGHASSDASLRYLEASERRDTKIANAIQRMMRGVLHPRIDLDEAGIG